jgi:transcriptional regulator with PAS, ATPase and Fis domain
VRGAFTGATDNKQGLFQAANQGTVFLDEIGETSLAMQVKLLRFLQEGEIKPVGSNETLHVDVRLITATNRELEGMVAAGSFRQDLYYRLNVIQITVPPLRERKDDIVPLAEFSIRKYSEKMYKSVVGMTDAVREILLRHDWPGNVRELENAMERAVALSTGKLVSKTDLPIPLSERTPGKKSAENGVPLSLKEVEKQHIGMILKTHNWNYELVTKLLGIGRTTLWRKMKEYDISNEPEL